MFDEEQVEVWVLDNSCASKRNPTKAFRLSDLTNQQFIVIPIHMLNTC